MAAALSRSSYQIVPAVSLPDVVEAVDDGGAEAVLVDDDGLGAAPALEAVGALLRHRPQLRVALLSASRSPVLPADALRSGAAAFLSKDMPLAELRFALERMLQGQLVVDPLVTRALLGLMGPDAEEPAANGNGRLYLTPVERKVLSQVAAGRANKQIAVALGLSPLTVKNHLARVRGRLGASDKAHAIAVALRAGLLD